MSSSTFDFYFYIDSSVDEDTGQLIPLDEPLVLKIQLQPDDPPIEMEIPLGDVDSSYMSCFYFNETEGAWGTEGIATTVEDGKLFCYT
mmetsp:Transcript_401/g.232  ORF Transcript_401/g.232 Transcript_401/m.232 type:complete len:88 (-) Transcript_401:279-542(-)